MARPRGLEFPTFWLPRQTVPVKFTLNKSFRFKEWCARGGLELPAFWLVAIRVKMLNALFGVAYGLETPFFPHLAAPNLAPNLTPKTELYRTCTEHFMSSIRKADFGHAVTASPSTPIRLGPFSPVGGFRLAMVGRFWPSSKRVSGEIIIRQRQVLQNSKNPTFHLGRLALVRRVACELLFLAGFLRIPRPRPSP